MKRLVPFLLAFLLMGQTCDGDPPPLPEPSYCPGSTATESPIAWVGRAWDAIIDGQIADDRYGTVRVAFGQSYCSGVIISEHTVLTAAHCGYAAEYHNVVAGGWGTKPVYRSTGKLPHPDYLEYKQNGNQGGNRQADIMLLYFEDDVLPEPYIHNIYSTESPYMGQCKKLLAQGWGRTEDNPETCPDGAKFCLRETEYTVKEELDWRLYTQLSDKEHGKICFGDSGGPLYAFIGNDPWVAGLASVTYSQDCLVGSAHTKVSAFAGWVYENAR